MDYRIAILLLLLLISCLGGLYTYVNSKNEVLSQKILSFFLFNFGFIFLATFLLNYYGPENTNLIIVLFSYLFFVFCLTLPPTFYFYVKSLVYEKSEVIDQQQFQFHYGLAISLLIINLFSFIALNNVAKDDSNYMLIENILKYCNFISLIFIFLLQNIYYILESSKLYVSKKNEVKEVNPETAETLVWMKYFIIMYSLTILMLYIFQLRPLLFGKMIFRVSMIVYIAVIIYFGQNNYVFSQDSGAKGLDIDIEKRLEMKKALNEIMKVEKPYLAEDLSLKMLAHQLNTNSKYLSFLINKEYDCNFSSFINSFRIKEAQAFLSDTAYNIYTIESIAKMTGFKSKSAFNSAFKKETNLTPSKFKSINQKQSQT